MLIFRPGAFAYERYELKALYLFLFITVSLPADNVQVLDIKVANGNYQDTSVFELRKQWLWDRWRSGCNDNTIEWSEFLPSNCPIAAFRGDAVAKTVKSLSGFFQ